MTDTTESRPATELAAEALRRLYGQDKPHPWEVQTANLFSDVLRAEGLGSEQLIPFEDDGQRYGYTTNPATASFALCVGSGVDLAPPWVSIGVLVPFGLRAGRWHVWFDINGWNVKRDGEDASLPDDNDVPALVRALLLAVVSP